MFFFFQRHCVCVSLSLSQRELYKFLVNGVSCKKLGSTSGLKCPWSQPTHSTNHVTSMVRPLTEILEVYGGLNVSPSFRLWILSPQGEFTLIIPYSAIFSEFLVYLPKCLLSLLLSRWLYVHLVRFV